MAGARAATASALREPQSTIARRPHGPDGTGPAGTTARTSYSLTAADGGTRFGYENEFKLPAGQVGEAASGVISGSAEREANDSLARLKALAEA